MLKKLVVAISICPLIALASVSKEMESTCGSTSGYSPQLVRFLDMSAQVISLGIIKNYKEETKSEAKALGIDQEYHSLIETLHRSAHQPFIRDLAQEHEKKLNLALSRLPDESVNEINRKLKCNLYQAQYDKDSAPNDKLIGFLRKTQESSDSLQEEVNLRINEIEQGTAPASNIRWLASMIQKKLDDMYAMEAAESSGQIGYFSVKVNSCSTSEEVGVEDPALEPEQWLDSKFLILDVSFKNTDSEGREPVPGGILIDYNKKIYSFDSVESIHGEGFGIKTRRVNPLLTLRTKLVYRVPSEITGKVVWRPGNNPNGITVLCGSI